MCFGLCDTFNGGYFCLKESGKLCIAANPQLCHETVFSGHKVDFLNLFLFLLRLLSSDRD